MHQFARSLIALALVVGAVPVSAEVVEAEAGHFVTRDEAVVKADLKATWLALIAPEKWWNGAHTFTGDADNLSLTPQAGGCFCEKVPEVDEPGRFTLEGSVQHLRVVNSMPENALRMVGALGPLQSEPVTGVLTIALSKVDGGTRIVWEYNVGGHMRYEVGEISKAVDGVMTQQLGGLAKLLGRVDAPAAKPVAPKPEPSDDEDASDNVDDAFRDLTDPG